MNTGSALRVPKGIAADQITRVALGDGGSQGLICLWPVVGRALWWNLAVAVHQDDEGLAAFVFHDERLDDRCARDIQFPPKPLCRRVLRSIRMVERRCMVLAEKSGGRRFGACWSVRDMGGSGGE